VKPRWDNVIRQPEHEPLGPFRVFRQTNGSLVVADRRRKLGEGIVARDFRTEEGAIGHARQLADAEGFSGVKWEGE
jgi:hypothetical protein